MWQSSSVYNELKHALKDKAIEHKIREAKALGIEVDEASLKDDYDKSLLEDQDDCSHKVNKTEYSNPVTQSINSNTFDFQFDFKSNKINLTEELFEDSNDSDLSTESIE